MKILIPFCIVICIAFSACKSTTPRTTNEVSLSEEYKKVSGNIARLQAMLTGKFVQQILTEIDSISQREIYTTWKVNDKEDSILLYSIPLDDPNRVGYWIYHYQIMTTLPDEPVYQAFESLVLTSRDTIKSIYYKAPDDFTITLSELLKTKGKSFQDVPLSKLEIEEDGGSYVRQDILHFNNKATIVPNPQRKDYKMDMYEIYPEHIFYSTIFYKDPKGKEPIESVKTKFLKLSRLK